MKKIFLCFFLLLLSVKFSYAEELISKIEKNWNQINTMSGRFMQIDPDEKISTGNFYFLNNAIERDLKILKIQEGKVAAISE